MGALVACDDVDPLPPAPQVISVTVVPQTVQLAVGQTASLAATVIGDAGLTDRTVTWSSSNPSIATVDANGVVRGVSAGQTTILAASRADANVKGAASVVVTAAAVPAISIATITKNGLPVDINNVQGQVDVTLNVAGNGAPVGGVALLVQCPNQTAPFEVQRQTFSNQQAPNGPITLSFNSAALNAAGTGALFANGACNIIARLLNAQGQPLAETGDVVRPITLQNQDYVAVTISARSAPDQLGNAWSGGDSVAVTVVPVIFSGQTVASGTVTITGTDTRTGTVVSPSLAFSGAGRQTVVFRRTVLSGTNPGGLLLTTTEGLTLPDGRVIVTLSTAAGNAIPAATQAQPLRLDTQSPVAGTYSLINNQGASNDWVGSAFVFSTANGYAAAAASPLPGGTSVAGNDFGGVDRVTVRFEVARLAAGQTCATTGLTYTTATNASALQQTQINNGYCLRMVELDALGNSRTTFLTDFGVDLGAPIITSITPADRSPVTPATMVTVVAQDSLSGFGTNPVDVSITRLTASGSNCINPTSGASSTIPTGGCATVAAGGAGVPGATTATFSWSATGTNTTEAYYTHVFTVRDQAANRTPVNTRQYVYDVTAPDQGPMQIPLQITGSTVSFTTFATDNLDVISANSSLLYPGVASIRNPTDVALNTPFDGTPNTRADFNVVFNNFMRSLAPDINTAGVRPNQVTIRAVDAAGNSNGEIDFIPSDRIPSTGPAFSTQGVQAFTTATSGANVCNPTSSTACTTPESRTLSANVTGASGVFQSPFARVDFWYVGAGGELIFIGSSTSASAVDNGTNRVYTYGGVAFNPPSSFVAGNAITVYAIGVSAAGDGVMATPVAQNVVLP